MALSQASAPQGLAHPLTSSNQEDSEGTRGPSVPVPVPPGSFARLVPGVCSQPVSACGFRGPTPWSLWALGSVVACLTAGLTNTLTQGRTQRDMGLVGQWEKLGEVVRQADLAVPRQAWSCSGRAPTAPPPPALPSSRVPANSIPGPWWLELHPGHRSHLSVLAQPVSGIVLSGFPMPSAPNLGPGLLRAVWVLGGDWVAKAESAKPSDILWTVVGRRKSPALWLGLGGSAGVQPSHSQPQDLSISPGARGQSCGDRAPLVSLMGGFQRACSQHFPSLGPHPPALQHLLDWFSSPVLPSQPVGCPEPQPLQTEVPPPPAKKALGREVAGLVAEGGATC